jgi:hypothetical protein
MASLVRSTFSRASEWPHDTVTLRQGVDEVNARSPANPSGGMIGLAQTQKRFDRSKVRSP